MIYMWKHFKSCAEPDAKKLKLLLQRLSGSNSLAVPLRLRLVLQDALEGTFRTLLKTQKHYFLFLNVVMG